MALDKLSPQVISVFKDWSDELVLTIAADWWKNFEGSPDAGVEALKELRSICRLAAQDSLDLFVLWGY